MNPPTNVVLVTIDCLRGDRFEDALQAGLLPNFAELVHGGTVFEAAYTVANATDPSLTSMMTGQIPPHHGVLENGWGLDPSIPVGAELFEDETLDAGAVVSVDHLADEHSGLGRGFDRYEDGGGAYDTIYPVLSRIYDTKTFNTVFGAIKNRGIGDVTVKDLLRRLGVIKLHERPATSVTDDTRTLLEELTPPFFLWTHYFDLHEPRNAPAAYRREHDRYTAAMIHLDDQMGTLLDTLKEHGIREETLIVLTADHGEALDDHGYTGHGRTLYDEELHVPLVFAHEAYPDRTVTAQVRTIDILPTIVSTLSDVELTVDGEPLFDDQLAPLEADRPLVAMAYPPFGNRHAVRVPAWKLIRDHDADTVELYDLEVDPGEDRNVADDHPDVVEELLTHVATWEQAAEDVTDQTVDEDTEEMLADLGYVD